MHNSYKSYQNIQDVYVLVKKIQINGTVFYQEFEKNIFNPTQEKLYLELMYGINAYPPEKIEKIPNYIKEKIAFKHRQVQRLVNKWKQEIINSSVDNLLLSLFPKSKIVEQFTKIKGTDDTIFCSASLKEVGLDKITIAKRLVKNNYLPKNFFKLT
jgi:hypothetical protein